MITIKPPIPQPLSTQSIAGTYYLSNLTIKVGNGPEENLSHLFIDEGANQRLMRLNSDNTLYYVKRRRNNKEKKEQTGKWNLLGRNKICIDGDTGTVTKFDGHLLQITSFEDSAFSTRITVTYTRE